MATAAPMVSTAVGVGTSALLMTPAVAQNIDTVAPNRVPVALLTGAFSSMISTPLPRISTDAPTEEVSVALYSQGLQLPVGTMNNMTSVPVTSCDDPKIKSKTLKQIKRQKKRNSQRR